MVGERLDYEAGTGRDGRPQAVRVRYMAAAAKNTRMLERAEAAQWGGASLFAIPAFLLLLGTLAWLWRFPKWWVAVYLGMSVVCFVAYALDKAAARREDRRTPESTLHLLSLLGGWPGALLAQQYLRHKSVKTEFRAVFWLTVIANLIGFVWLVSPAGSAWWQATTG